MPKEVRKSRANRHAPLGKQIDYDESLKFATSKKSKKVEEEAEEVEEIKGTPYTNDTPISNPFLLLHTQERSPKRSSKPPAHKSTRSTRVDSPCRTSSQPPPRNPTRKRTWTKISSSMRTKTT